MLLFQGEVLPARDKKAVKGLKGPFRGRCLRRLGRRLGRCLRPMDGVSMNCQGAQGRASLRPPAMLYHLMASEFASLVYMRRMRKGRGKELLHTYISELSLGTQNGPKLRALFVWYEHLLMFRFPCHLYMRTREFRAILGSSTFLKNT